MCFLKREEAILVLKELFEKCPFLDGRYLALMPAEPPTLMSQKYQILIKTSLDEETRNCMQDILIKYQLTIKIKEENTFITYRPIQTKE